MGNGKNIELCTKPLKDFLKILDFKKKQRYNDTA